MFNVVYSKLKSWIGGYKYRYYCNFYGDYKVGRGTKIGSFCDINAKIGKNCLIQSFVFIPQLTVIEDNVFIGPGTVICNDKYPPSNNFKGVKIRNGAKIGARAVILPGVEIGECSLIGAGAVVVDDVMPYSVVVGNPAKKI